jgi:hypothetical protein
MDGAILTLAQDGASVGCNFRSGETSVWMFCGLGNAVKKLCGDLLAVHLRKCMMGKMETFSHRPMGKVVQPLQSVNYHDSHAHGHERHGPFTLLVGILVWVGFSRSGYGVQQV